MALHYPIFAEQATLLASEAAKAPGNDLITVQSQIYNDFLERHKGEYDTFLAQFPDEVARDAGVTIGGTPMYNSFHSCTIAV